MFSNNLIEFMIDQSKTYDLELTYYTTIIRLFVLILFICCIIATIIPIITIITVLFYHILIF